MRQMAGTAAGFPGAAAGGGGQVACRPFRVAAGQAWDPGVVAVQLWNRLTRARACQQLAGDRIVMASAAKGALLAPGAADAAGSILRDRLRVLDGGAGGSAPLGP